MVIICPNLANLKGQNMNGIRGGFNTRPNFFRIFFSATVPNNKLYPIQIAQRFAPGLLLLLSSLFVSHVKIQKAEALCFPALPGNTVLPLRRAGRLAKKTRSVIIGIHCSSHFFS